VTLGPNGLFYQGSHGGMYKQRCERLSRPLGGTVVGLAPEGGLVGHPPDGTPAPPKNKKIGSASAWARFLMGLGKQCQERRSRHLGVVGMVVGRRLVWSSPQWNAGPKQNGQRFRVCLFCHGFGKTTPQMVLPALGVVGLAVECAPGWGIVFIPSMERRADTMGSASVWARFIMGVGRRHRERLGVTIVFLALAPFAPAAGPSRTKSSSPSSPLGTFSMDAAKGNPLLGGALGFPPVSAGSSCRAFVRSLARAFIGAAVVLAASLAVGPAPPSEARFTDAHGLVGACVVLAPGRVTVAPTLLRSCRSNHRRRRGHLAVTLQ
jgi:hypothetical protein